MLKQVWSTTIIAGLVATLLLSFALPVQATTIITPFTIQDTASVDHTNEPATGGIPLPVSANILSTAALTVQDVSTATIPSQFEVTERWGGTPSDASRPIKWLLVTLPATVASGSSTTYNLISGTTNSTSTSLTVSTNNSTDLIIATGAATFTLKKQNFSWIKTAAVNSITVTDSSSNGIVLTDSNNVIYTSNNDTPTTFQVTEQGAERIVVKVTGTLRDASNNASLDYTAYLYFYANQTYVPFILTLGNHRAAMPKINCCGYDVYDYNGQNSFTAKDISLQLQLNTTSSLQYVLPNDTGNSTGSVNTTLSAYQATSGSTYWNRYDSSDDPRTNNGTQFKGYQVTNNGSAVTSGNHYAGWLNIANGTNGVSVGLQNFWQNFPKKLTSNQTGLVQIDLYPDSYSSTYNFRVGDEKTYRGFINFQTDNPTATQVSNLAQSLASPLWLSTPATWYQSSGALQEFSLASGSIESRFGQVDSLPTNFDKYQYYNDRTIIPDPNFTGVYSTYYPFHSLWLSNSAGPSSIDYFNFYGYSYYGNQPIDFEMYADGKAGTFNSKYNFDFASWLQYFRSGDTRWRDMATAFSQTDEQYMLHDIVTSTGFDIYRWQNAMFGHENHTETSNTTGPRNSGGPVDDTAFGAEGSAMYYYLTGDPISQHYAIAAADYFYNFYGPLGTGDGTYHYQDYSFSQNVRSYSNAVTTLTTGAEITGDTKYLQLVQGLFNYEAPSNLPWISGPVAGSSDSINVWMFAMYLSAMGRYGEVTNQFPGWSSESTLTKQRLVTLADWLTTTASKNPAGWLETYYYWNYNGDNDATTSQMVNNWALAAADVCGYAYSFTSDPKYLDYGERYFDTGANNPAYPGSGLTYSESKDAVNSAVFGSVFMYYDQLARNNFGGTPDHTPPNPNSNTNTNSNSNTNTNGDTIKPIIDTFIWNSDETVDNSAQTTMIVGNNGVPSYHVLLKFDVSSIPNNATVTNAHMILTSAQGGPAYTIHLKPLTTNWSETGATWLTTNRTTHWTTPGGDAGTTITDFAVPTLNQSVSVNLTNQAQRWVSGTDADDGVVLELDSGTYWTYIYFYSTEAANTDYRPQFVITYTVPTPPDTNSNTNTNVNSNSNTNTNVNTNSNDNSNANTNNNTNGGVNTNTNTNANSTTNTNTTNPPVTTTPQTTQPATCSTLAQNGVDQHYSHMNLQKGKPFNASIKSITSADNGVVQITYADGAQYCYQIFNSTTTKHPHIKHYPKTGYLIVALNHQLRIVNAYTGKIVAIKHFPTTRTVKKIVSLKKNKVALQLLSAAGKTSVLKLTLTFKHGMHIALFLQKQPR